MNSTTPSTLDIGSRACTAFSGTVRIASGTYTQVVQALQGRPATDGPVIIFDDETAGLIDAPGGAVCAVAATAPGDPAPAPAVGRPRLGVVAREVTLLPRHWDWLGLQPSGASAALRRLVEEARRNNANRDVRRAAQERSFRFINAIAGNLANFEDAARALFAGDPGAFETHLARWPTDVAAYARRLAANAFAGEQPAAPSASPALRAGTVHLVYGPIGAGKTTYAQAWTERVGGVCFSIDVWMRDLFGADLPAHPDLDWVLQRVERCELRIWATACALAQRGVDVVLDIGAMRASDRRRVLQSGAAAALTVRTHHVTADRQTRRERVAARNAQRAGTYAFDISPALFDAMDRLFEAPTEEELAAERAFPP